MSIRVKNTATVDISSIPILEYEDFYDRVSHELAQPNAHCLTYHAVPFGDELRFFCAVANDASHTYSLFSFVQKLNAKVALESLTATFFSMHIFEREISENFGIEFFNHPWPKPVRWAFDRADKNKVSSNYPFFKINGTRTHEVGVGPIHAGVIEPGHFRFSCFGEEVKHLEIHLGYQHRGIESLYLQKKDLLQRTILSESISGDMVVGHTLTFVQLMEALHGETVCGRIQYLRALALELERMAVHVGDLGALCTDVAYQLGSSVFGALRTPLINFFQQWCGSRFGKGLLRVGYNPYPFTNELADNLSLLLARFKVHYEEMADKTFTLASIMNRFEKTGHVTKEEAETVGLVGMIARSCGVKRDVRNSHPYGAYAELILPTHVLKSGDVYARGKIRDLEIRMSMEYIEALSQKIKSLPEDTNKPTVNFSKKPFSPNTWCLSMTEAWRGHTVHAAITNERGEIHHYKVIDPSMHNWMGLALAVRNNEISDFPICNKSFDLSYCGHDL